MNPLDLFSPELRAAIEALVDERVAERLADRQAERDDGWPEWMRLPTASRYIDVSENALRKRAERGELSYSQEGPGCALWFSRTELDAYMAGQRHEARSSR